jgi:UDP-N-acetylmuramyl pentapeptide phosphotransferase/UDP-N-acetylglucosamine-1-phosphate transferase
MTKFELFGILLTVAIASFALSMLIVFTQHWHGRLSLDHDLSGVQKIHTCPVPRIGGFALFGGMLLAIVFLHFAYPAMAKQLYALQIGKLLLASIPAFLAGIVEDLTKKVSVRIRLLATFASALIACWLLGATLVDIDTVGFDILLKFAPVAIVFTVFAVGGVANSINIIDGFNGLAGSAVVIMLAGLGFLSRQVGDVFVMQLALFGIGATLGFLLVNYPTGKLFLGDGGAYFLGFWLAEVAVLLIVRNPSVNAWQVLTICAYPVIEVVYSIYRRKVVRNNDPGKADNLHLHSLIYEKVVCRLFQSNDNMPWLRNAMVTPMIAAGVTMFTLITVWAGQSYTAAVVIVLFEIWLYLAAYKRLISGRWRLNPLAFSDIGTDGVADSVPESL